MQKKPHGSVVWSEIMTRDTEASRKFYTETLGWEYGEMPSPDGSTYYLCKAGEHMTAGMMDISAPAFDGVPECWFTYLCVDDVDARLAQAEANGGKIIRPPFEIPNVGRIGILQDSTGVTMGWITPSDGVAE